MCSSDLRTLFFGARNEGTVVEYLAYALTLLGCELIVQAHGIVHQVDGTPSIACVVLTRNHIRQEDDDIFTCRLGFLSFVFYILGKPRVVGWSVITLCVGAIIGIGIRLDGFVVFFCKDMMQTKIMS